MTTDLIKAHLNILLQSCFCDLTRLKSMLKPDSVDLGHLFQSLQNLISVDQDASLSDKHAVLDRNWNARLILAELTQWWSN